MKTKYKTTNKRLVLVSRLLQDAVSFGFSTSLIENYNQQQQQLQQQAQQEQTHKKLLPCVVGGLK